MPVDRPPLRALAFAAGVAGLLAGCGQQPQGGGMPGFPPAEVTTVAVQPASFPVAFEYVGQAAGSKDAEVRSRVTGIVEKRLYQEGARVRAGQPAVVRAVALADARHEKGHRLRLTLPSTPLWRRRRLCGLLRENPL